jgi:hypothetical protein
MKLVSREADRLVFKLSKREHEALMTTLRLAPLFPRGESPISRDSTKLSEQVPSAQADLDEALADHRLEQTEGITRLLTDPKRCSKIGAGAWNLTLTVSDADRMLQVLNEIRVGAWEKLGRPDFEEGSRPEVTEENFLCFWAFQLTDVFEGQLLAALDGEESEDETDDDSDSEPDADSGPDAGK